MNGNRPKQQKPKVYAKDLKHPDEVTRSVVGVDGKRLSLKQRRRLKKELGQKVAQTERSNKLKAVGDSLRVKKAGVDL